MDIEVCCVFARALQPVPVEDGVYYFEVKVINQVRLYIKRLKTKLKTVLWRLKTYLKVAMWRLKIYRICRYGCPRIRGVSH